MASYTLGDICELINGGAWNQSEYVNNGIPVVQVSNMKNGTIDISDLKFLSSSSIDRYKKHMLKKDDLLIATVGSHATQASAAGRATIVKENASGMLLNQNAVAIRSKSKVLDQRYLGLLGSSDKFQSYLDTVGKGAANQVRIALSAIRQYKFDLPPIEEQLHAVEILSAYDDLIENNRRRIALLEHVARLLYREWFVRLRFPGHENVRIEDGVPEGWEKKTFGDVSCFISRGITPKYDDEAPGIVINQKCIRDRKVTLEQARHQSREVPPKKIVRYGDVLINSTGQGTLGRVAQFLDSIEGCTVDSHVTIARPAEFVPIFLYGQQISSMEDYLAVMGRGATNQTELSRETIASLPVLCPPNEIACHFEMFKEETARLTQNLIQQNIKLAKSRNLLLPSLMNGEIAI